MPAVPDGPALKGVSELVFNLVKVGILRGQQQRIVLLTDVQGFDVQPVDQRDIDQRRRHTLAC